MCHVTRDLLPEFKSLVFLVTWATFPNQGPELSNGMEERKLGIALATLAFFPVICLTMEFKIAPCCVYAFFIGLHVVSETSVGGMSGKRVGGRSSKALK